LSVTAPGFRSLKQDNLTVNALGVLGFNPVLSIGEAAETVEVSAAPPVLNTTNATVGLVMENSTYANLPLQMNNAQRDATAFASLAPGAQSGIRVPIVGGTGNYLGQLSRRHAGATASRATTVSSPRASTSVPSTSFR
jgi:hypothetical protein